MAPSHGLSPTTPKSTMARAMMPAAEGAQNPAVESHVVLLVVRRLWFFFVVIFLTVVMFAIVGPLFQFVVLTFFASYHGGGDCMSAPKSDPCRLAAGDMTTYNSIVGFVTSSVSVVTALTLGSLSDSFGRKWIFVVKGLLSTLMIYALALYQMAGLSLWIFLLLRVLVAMWDFNGVSMALMADVIPERDLRGKATSITIALVLIVVLVCMALAAVLPVDYSFAIAITAASIKIIFYFTYFPETSKGVSSADSRKRRGPVGALRAAYDIITMNSFIFRMACIAVIGGISSVGTGIVVQPYLTSYIGMKRQEMAALSACIIGSVLLTLGVLSKPIIAYCGDVRTYQLCLLGVSLLPAGFCFCSEPWQVMVLMGVFMGPVILQVPIISAIKSNLVTDAEQGLVQGALAALVNLASALAAPIFGFMYNWFTQNGAIKDRSAAFPSLIAASVVGVIAFLVSLSLPLEIPEPVGDSDSGLNEVFLQTSGDDLVDAA